MNRWITAPFSSMAGEGNGESREMLHKEGQMNDKVGNESGRRNMKREQNGKQMKGSEAMNFSFFSLLKLAVTYISIILAIAIITYAIIEFINGKDKRKKE